MSHNKHNKLRVPQFALSELEFLKMADKLSTKWESNRYKNIKRPYEASLIVSKRGSLTNVYTSNLLAHKLWNTFKTRAKAANSSPIISMTIVNAIQAFHAAKYLDAIHISNMSTCINGPSNTMPTSYINSYYMDSVINKVGEVFRCLEFHERKQRELHGYPQQLQYHLPKDYQADFLAPIIADIDSTHGGITGLMKTVTRCVENGAAGIVINDTSSIVDNLTNPYNRVIVPVSEFINRLIACRVQLDILDCDHVIFVKSISNSACLISSDIDSRDHPFILGATNSNLTRLKSILQVAIDNKASDSYLANLEINWLRSANLMTFVEAVSMEIKRTGGLTAPLLLSDWLDKSQNIDLNSQKELAKSYGINIFWDANLPRSLQGCYRYKPCIEASISRALHYMEHCDVCVLDATTPSMKDAENFAKEIRKEYPDVLLSYNIPILIDWDSVGLSEKELSSYHETLLEFGYVHHHFETAGLQAQSLISHLFAKDFNDRGLYAYIEGVQRPESYHQIQTNYNHYWTGSEYTNRVMRIAVPRKSASSFRTHLNIMEKENKNNNNR